MKILSEMWRRAWRGVTSTADNPPTVTAVSATARGRIIVERLHGFTSRALGGARPIDVFLPLGYNPAGAVRYPVLYLNDGQDGEALNLAATLERLQEAGRIPGLLVVAVHATGDRIREYGTAGTPNAQRQGDRATEYEEFLLEEVLPFVERRYPTRTGPEATAIAGLSLGGLSAFDLAWRHPDRFGAVGVLSGSFWWRTDDGTPAARQASRIMHRRVRETRHRPALRMWFESGRGDETADRDGNGTIDSIQDTEELIVALVSRGYQRGRDVEHLVVGGGHNLMTWREVLPQMLCWLWPNPAPAEPR